MNITRQCTFKSNIEAR